MELPEGERIMVLAPLVRDRKGEYGKLLDGLRADGYARVKVDGELRTLDEEIELDIGCTGVVGSSPGSASGWPTRSR